MDHNRSEFSCKDLKPYLDFDPVLRPDKTKYTDTVRHLGEWNRHWGNWTQRLLGSVLKDLAKDSSEYDQVMDAFELWGDQRANDACELYRTLLDILGQSWQAQRSPSEVVVDSTAPPPSPFQKPPRGEEDGA